MKLNQDRIWCLKQFKDSGWSYGRGNWDGVKKWDAHKAALVKGGLLLVDDHGFYCITEAGRAALEGK